MQPDQLERILRDVKAGRVGIDEALRRIRESSLARLEFATLDLERATRRGFPEVVFGPGKTAEQIVEIVGRLVDAGQTAMVTRVGPDVHAVVRAEHPAAEYHALARAIVLRARGRGRPRAGVVVITAGTGDRPVAEEAALTAEVMGCRVERIQDVGVAGLHRLLSHKAALTRARVIVVVAGMEGALPSVVAGLTGCPVIGVPTDLGFGPPDGGRAALGTMLNSCAAGLTVVNVNNGFGAGFAAALINRGPAPAKARKNHRANHR